MKTTPTSPTNRFSTALQLLEQRLWLVELEYTRMAALSIGKSNFPLAKKMREQLQGAVTNRATLRRRIMSDQPISKAEFNIPDGPSESEFGGKGRIFATLPAMLQHWCQSSRRVFTLTAEMQKLLEIAAVGNVCWGEITFPLASFIVKLPIPIIVNGENGGTSTIDSVLVSKTGDELRLLAFGPDMDDWKPLSAEVVRQAQGHFEQQCWRKMDRLVSRKLGTSLYSPVALSFSMPAPADQRLKDLEGMDVELHQPRERNGGEIAAELMAGATTGHTGSVGKMPEEVLLLLRIIVGLCLHLESAGTRIVTDEAPNTAIRPARDDAQNAGQTLWHFVDNPKEILDIPTPYPLSAIEEQIHRRMREIGLLKADAEFSVLWRRSHWRRPPGRGGDIDYPKSVRVRWAMVGAKHLPPGAVATATATEFG